MKTTLKGYRKYIPGTCYGMFLTMLAGLIMISRFYAALSSIGEPLDVILICGSFMALFFLFSFLGKKIYRFTESFYENHSLTFKHSKQLADWTEILFFIFAVISLILITVLLAELRS